MHRAFLRALGSPNYCNHDASCARNVQHASLSVMGSGRKSVSYDLKNSRHVVLQLRNIFEAVNVQEVNDLLDAVEGLCVRLPGFTLEAISFQVAAGEFFTILGPTGSGKTLILESIAGLVPIHSGWIRINGRDVTDLPPERRQIGIVYQDQSLFLHLSVIQNIRYGLRYRPRAADRKEKIAYLIQQLGLEPLLERGVANLSGGERQRVAMARALAVAPDVLLLDEPLSALDPKFREEIRGLLRRLHHETGITALMVTHDFAEAHFLATRTAVIGAGRIEQIGPVAEVFNRPLSPAVAAFVGMRNIFEARFDGGAARAGGLTFSLADPFAHQPVAG